MNIFDEAQNLGILTEFYDGQGVRNVTDEAALKLIVEAFPKSPPHRLLAGPVVVRSGRAAHSQLGVETALPVELTILSQNDGHDEVASSGKATERGGGGPGGRPGGAY